jgi:hypothetical protein
LIYIAAKFFRVCESEWKGFTVRLQQEKLNFIIKLGIEMITKAQIRYFGFGSPF